jgi:hypothetical protein
MKHQQGKWVVRLVVWKRTIAGIFEQVYNTGVNPEALRVRL